MYVIHSQRELISLRLISSRASPYQFKSCFANLCKHDLLSPFELALLIANLNFQGCIAVYLSRYIVAFDRNKVNVTTLFCGCQQLFQTFHRFFQAVLTWTFSRWNYILTLFIFNVNYYFKVLLRIHFLLFYLWFSFNYLPVPWTINSCRSEPLGFYFYSCMVPVSPILL